MEHMVSAIPGVATEFAKTVCLLAMFHIAGMGVSFGKDLQQFTRVGDLEFGHSLRAGSAIELWNTRLSVGGGCTKAWPFGEDGVLRACFWCSSRLDARP